MKKLLFAIFAHPDDESFGPSGTLMAEAKNGTEVHLITLTAGEAGMNPDSHDDLAAIRLREWHEAGRLIGATDQHHLGFTDGKLDNKAMLEVAEKIEQLVEAIAKDSAEPCEIEFMSNDLNGISGHIDHIVAARAACLAFYRLREKGLSMKQVRLACIPRDLLPTANTKWLYMEPGRTSQEIDETVDVSEHLETIEQIVQAHHTQREDGEKHLRHLHERLAINHFIVLD